MATPQPINEELREQRRRQILDAAMTMVSREGLPNVTVQRLADDLGCSVGLLYRYFDSKDAMLAELEREALEVLGASLAASQAAIAELAAERGVGARVAALSRALGAATFWVTAEATFPRQVELSQRLFTDPVVVLEEAAAARALPAAVRLLDSARSVLDDAVGAGALTPGVSLERAVIVVAGTTGVLLTSGIRRWGPSLFDGPHLAGVMIRDLFRGWGADGADLAAAEELVAEMASRGELVPGAGSPHAP